MAKVKTPRIAELRVANFRVLKDVHLPALTPFTVVVGPNGSGKSTLFDVFAFLADSLGVGLRAVWEHRGRFRELRSRGAEGPIRFEVTYVNQAGKKLRYVLAIDETDRGPVVAEEKLMFTRGSRGKPFVFLEFAHGEGVAYAGETPDVGAEREQQTLAGSDLLAVNALGQLARHPRVAEFRSFVIGWYLSHVAAASTRGVPEAGPQERLSASGDNLPNVVQYLAERHPDRWQDILRRLAARVPRLSEVTSRVLEDGRLMLRFRDAPFADPVLARFASDGTEGNEVRVINRGEDGYARITTVTDLPGVREHVEAGAVLGDLWMEGFLTPQWATEPERW